MGSPIQMLMNRPVQTVIEEDTEEHNVKLWSAMRVVKLTTIMRLNALTPWFVQTVVRRAISEITVRKEERRLIALSAIPETIHRTDVRLSGEVTS